MSYTRVNWQDQPSTATPINAQNLNTMDSGIARLETSLNNSVSTINSTINQLSNRAKTTTLFSQYPLTSGDNEYTLSDDINNYDLLVISGKFYDNVFGGMQATVTVPWFNTTTLGQRAVYMSNTNADYGFAKGTAANKITIRFTHHTGTGESYYGAQILGIKL